MTTKQAENGEHDESRDEVRARYKSNMRRIADSLERIADIAEKLVGERPKDH